MFKKLLSKLRNDKNQPTKTLWQNYLFSLNFYLEQFLDKYFILNRNEKVHFALLDDLFCLIALITH